MSKTTKKAAKKAVAKKSSKAAPKKTAKPKKSAKPKAKATKPTKKVAKKAAAKAAKGKKSKAKTAAKKKSAKKKKAKAKLAEVAPMPAQAEDAAAGADNEQDPTTRITAARQTLTEARAAVAEAERTLAELGEPAVLATRAVASAAPGPVGDVDATETKASLMRRATAAGIVGRYRMTRAELVDALDAR